MWKYEILHLGPVLYINGLLCPLYRVLYCTVYISHSIIVDLVLKTLNCLVENMVIIILGIDRHVSVGVVSSMFSVSHTFFLDIDEADKRYSMASNM